MGEYEPITLGRRQRLLSRGHLPLVQQLAPAGRGVGHDSRGMLTETIEDIALGALYLASPAASYVTGEILGVNGGLTRLNMDMPRAF